MSGTTARSGGFSIGILAVDKASAVINKVTRSLASMRAPADRMGQSLNALGNVTGINKAAKGLGGLARVGLSAAKSLGAVGGLTAKIGSIGSIAGIIALENSFARMGQTLTNNSKLLGMAPSQLAQWQNALNLQTGVSAETTAAGLRSMQNTAADAAFGQNGQAATYLQMALGNNWRTLSQDPRKEYMALSRWFQTFKGPYAQVAMSRVASAVGMPDEMVPAAMQGPKALQAALDQAKKLGSPSDKQIDDATSLAKSLRAADQAAANLGTTIADKLSTAAQGVTKDITAWTVSANKFIQTKVGDHIGDLKTALGAVGKNLGDLPDPLNTVVSILTSPAVLAIANPWTALGIAIADLSGTGPRSFSKLGLALTSIGFGVVANQIVKDAVKAAGGSDGTATRAGNFAQDVTTGAGLGAVLGPEGAVAGAALGAAYWGLTTSSAIPKSANLPPDIAAEVKKDAARYGVPESFALAQFRAEGGGYDKVSSAGAFGPAQLMPDTAKSLGVAFSVKDPSYNWRSNVDAGMRYDAMLLHHYNKQLSLVAAGYNMGPTATDKWIEAGHNVSALNDQTAEYVKQIQANGGIPQSPQLGQPGNIGFGFTPSKANAHPGEYEAFDGRWLPLNEPDPAETAPIRPAGGGDGPGRDLHIIIENIHKSDGTVQSRVKSASPGVKTTVNTSQPTFNTAMPGGLY